MADGSHAFNFPRPQTSRLRPGEIVVDLFAGGGGASEALKQALGVDPALADLADVSADRLLGSSALERVLRLARVCAEARGEALLELARDAAEAEARAMDYDDAERAAWGREDAA